VALLFIIKKMNYFDVLFINASMLLTVGIGFVAYECYRIYLERQRMKIYQNHMTKFCGGMALGLISYYYMKALINRNAFGPLYDMIVNVYFNGDSQGVTADNYLAYIDMLRQQQTPIFEPNADIEEIFSQRRQQQQQQPLNFQDLLNRARQVPDDLMQQRTPEPMRNVERNKNANKNVNKNANENRHRGENNSFGFSFAEQRPNLDDITENDIVVSI